MATSKAQPRWEWELWLRQRYEETGAYDIMRLRDEVYTASFRYGILSLILGEAGFGLLYLSEKGRKSHI